MKKQLIYLLASAGLRAAGCSTENDTEATGYGTLSVSCTADTSIDTASSEASGTPEAPAAGAFSLTVTGETGTQKWDTLTEFEQSETVFRMGSYTVAIAHGNPDAEGAGKPYYYAEQKIEVLPRRTVNADLTATVANSQVVIRATEQFLAYFHDAAHLPHHHLRCQKRGQRHADHHTRRGLHRYPADRLNKGIRLDAAAFRGTFRSSADR